MLSTKLETSSLKLAIAGSLALRSYHHSDDLNAAVRTAVIAKLDMIVTTLLFRWQRYKSSIERFHKLIFVPIKKI
jgi:hypothetical protein